MKIHNKRLFKGGAVLFILCFCLLLFFNKSVWEPYLLTPLISGIILMVVALGKRKQIKD